MRYDGRSERRVPALPTLESGTTTIGLRTPAGVVLATDHRATMGHFIASKTVAKLFRVDRHLGATLAGSLGDAQRIVRQLQSEAATFRTRVGYPIRVEAAATFASNLLNATRWAPYLGWFILGGVDATGPRLFSLEFTGGCCEERFVSLGSGSPFVYGVLEAAWRSEMGLSDAVDLALRGIAVAARRDSASGDGASIATITERGYEELATDELRRRVGRLQLNESIPIR